MSQPLRPLFLSLAPVILCGGLFLGIFTHRPASTLPEPPQPTLVRSLGRLLRIPSARQFTPEELAYARHTAELLSAQNTARFPELQVTWRQIDEAQNGFLALARFSQQKPDPFAEAEKIRVCRESWNSATARELLHNHAGKFAELRRIVTLPPGSSAPFFAENPLAAVTALPLTHGTDLFLISARLAAEQNNAARALVEITSASKIPALLKEVDAPLLTGTAIAAILEGNIRKSLFAEILPALGQTTDLAPWRTLIAAPSPTMDHLTRSIRGEWHGAAVLSFQGMVCENLQGKLPDPEPAARALAQVFAGQIRALEENSPFDADEVIKSAKLSQQGADFAKFCSFGYQSWPAGWRRMISSHALDLAALDLLILEKSGVTLSAESTQAIGHDPATGKPFLFHPATRMFSLPPENADASTIDPVKLPW